MSRRAPWTANESRRFPRLGLGVGPVSLVARVGQAPLPRVSRGGRCAEWVCPSWPAVAEQEVSLAQAGCVADTSPRAGRRQRRLTWLLEVAPGLWLGAGSRGEVLRARSHAVQAQYALTPQWWAAAARSPEQAPCHRNIRSVATTYWMEEESCMAQRLEAACRADAGVWGSAAPVKCCRAACCGAGGARTPGRSAGGWLLLQVVDCAEACGGCVEGPRSCAAA